jgi:predicted nucleotidyltransferase
MTFLLEAIEQCVPGATVWAFGSRVKGSSRPASDLDLAFLCDNETAKKDLPRLSETLRESDLPFKIQILDFNRLPENMKENIRRQYVLLYKPPQSGAQN